MKKLYNQCMFLTFPSFYSHVIAHQNSIGQLRWFPGYFNLRCCSVEAKQRLRCSRNCKKKNQEKFSISSSAWVLIWENVLRTCSYTSPAAINVVCCILPNYWGYIVSRIVLLATGKKIEKIHRLEIVWTFIGNRMDFWLSIIIVYFHSMDIEWK